MEAKEPKNIYQLKITLKHIRPPIWRRIQVPGDYNLYDLHDVIQDVFGWLDYHLHEFRIGNSNYGNPELLDEFDEFGINDESDFAIQDLDLKEGKSFVYEYDFGDSWEHTVLIEKILPYDKNKKLPICIKGKRACPPEDVGGIWGYQMFLEAINGPKNEEHESYMEWIGGEFDPELFNLKSINDILQRKIPS